MVYYGVSHWAPSEVIFHHGIKGQKWGIRRYQNDDGSLTAAGRKRYGADSVKGNVHRVLAGIYSINEKTYSKLGNKALASMNRAAKEEQINKANAADKAKQILKEQKKENDKAKVDVSKARNSATRRVAEDYHRLSDLEFASKYHTTKKTFARRYNKTNGDTYNLGRKKQALAIAYLSRKNGNSMSKTVKEIMKYDALSKAEQKALDNGHEYAANLINIVSEESINRKYLNGHK